MASKHRRRTPIGRLAGGAVAAVATGGVAVAALVLGDHFFTASSDASPAVRTAQHSSARATTAVSSTSASASPTARAVPLHVLSATPAEHATVSGTEPIVIRFDSAVARTSVMPSITPQTPGHWTQPAPDTLRFDPDVPFVPDTNVTVGVRDVTAADGGRLDTATTLRYSISDGSLLRVQQLLAQLQYLPLTFTAQSAQATTPAVEGALAFDPPPGNFAWRFPSTPPALAALWSAGRMTPMTTGAIMAFENVHGLDVDGVAGPAVWAALLHDAVAHASDPRPYTWAWTTMTRPETLQIWSDGQFVFSSKANTGIAAAATPIGSWPVFARYRSQEMKGTNPDGTKYDDPGVPFINYFNGGDAIHGFNRASYGSPQSLGCIELPYDAAAQVWQLIDYGTVVTVTR